MPVASATKVLHPARFSDRLLEAIGDMLAPYGQLSILDPFAGTGRIHELRARGHRTLGVEIETQWANLHPGTICGNSLELARLLRGTTWDAVATSPSYGNRFADAHTARDTCKNCRGTGSDSGRRCPVCLGTRLSMRRSYTHDLRRMTGDASLELAEDNSGKMQWGVKYRSFHEAVWAQVPGLLRGPRLFLLNCKDHVRNRERQHVVDWHVGTLEALGFVVLERTELDTGGLRHGANQERFAEELVLMRLNDKPSQPSQYWP